MNPDRIVETLIVLACAAVIISLIVFTYKREVREERQTCSALLTRAPDRLDSLEIVLKVPMCEHYLSKESK